MAKPPILGKVKTRLAKDCGNELALDYYIQMLEETIAFSTKIFARKTIHFTERNSFTDSFSLFEKNYQTQGDLGIKMAYAFEQEFSNGATKAVMIGTDCPDNSSEIISDAFSKLELADVVLGPSKDGGYYLIGMKKLHISIFQNKIWSTKTVFREALEEIKKLGLKHAELPIVNDIDTMDDLKESYFFQK